MTTTQASRRGRPVEAGSIASITDTIGDTPLVALSRIAREKGVVARLLGQARILQSDRRASRTASALR